MRIELMLPEELTPGKVRDVLALVGVAISEQVIGRWSLGEQRLAYDWAFREHLVASDYSRRLRRDKPRFVFLAALAEKSDPVGEFTDRALEM